MTKLKILLAQIFFCILIVPFTIVLFFWIVAREAWRACLYIYLDFRCEMASVPKQWRSLRDI
jgi:hypothetical protein